MMGGMNPKQMQKMMKQMGINTKEINCNKVVFECEDANIIVTEPQVTEVDMSGNKTYQVTGNIQEVAALTNDDIEIVVEKTGVPREKAEEALKKCNGDIAEAIVSLQE